MLRTRIAGCSFACGTNHLEVAGAVSLGRSLFWEINLRVLLIALLGSYYDRRVFRLAVHFLGSTTVCEQKLGCAHNRAVCVGGNHFLWTSNLVGKYCPAGRVTPAAGLHSGLRPTIRSCAAHLLGLRPSYASGRAFGWASPHASGKGLRPIWPRLRLEYQAPALSLGASPLIQSGP